MAQQLTMGAMASSPVWSWRGAWDFLKNELAPHAGRSAVVLRAAIAATVMMLCIMTFRLPGAALGAYYTLVISRDSTHGTVSGALTIFGAVLLGLANVLIGAALFAGSPLMHFIWIACSLFVIFFMISAATQYNFATSFGFLVTATIPIWDFPTSVDTAVSNTLWAALGVLVAAGITIVVEIIFAAFRPLDLIEEGVDVRLRIVAAFLRNATNPESGVQSSLTQYADIGTGNLRRILTRTETGQESYARKAALLALAGRLIDLCAGLLASNASVTKGEQERLIEMAARIDQIRVYKKANIPDAGEDRCRETPGCGFVQLIETTVQLMDDVLEQPDLMREYILPEDIPKTRIFKSDAFTNRGHLKFALRGTAAALICYLAYHLLDWQGLYNSVATCMVTALSTTGSSRQKQILRVAGAITGGLCLAIAAEVLLLPHMDSIAQFTLLFAAVTICSAWFATSSPRLSYYGLQMAFAFYIVLLRTFAPETQLTPARDNVVGILLGLLAMWLVFDQLTPHNSLSEMKQNLVGGIRSISAYIREPQIGSRASYLKRLRMFRDSANDSFAKVRSSADAVLFEFGPNRAEALRMRTQVKSWQPQLRTLFVLQITLAHMRLRVQTGNLDPPVEHLRLACAQILNELAGILEHMPNGSSIEERDGAFSPTEIQAARGSVAGSLAIDSVMIAEGLLDQLRIALKPGAS